MRMIVALLLALATATASSETFHERVVGLYSFSPHKLSQSEIEAKSGELDLFWASVKAGGPAVANDLRAELRRDNSSPFFSYDGAKLLLDISKAKEDQALALTAMSRTDLRDLQRTDYFQTIHWLSVNEFDTTQAAFKILEEDDFKAFIPQHALTLNQEMCLLFLLLPTKEEFYLEKASQNLFTVKSITAQKSLLSLLGHTATRSGDEAIARFAADADKPKESRDYANKIMEASKEMASEMVLGFSMSSYQSLKEEQRKLLARVSDEALYEWERLRIKIRRKGYL